MAAVDVAAAHYRRQTRIARAAASHTAALWSRVDRNNILASWSAVLGLALAPVIDGQLLAAGSADGYVDEATEAAGNLNVVRPQAFAGIASDGRNLAALLREPAITALQTIGRGAEVNRAMATGAMQLDMIVRTQVADAGRVADGVAIAARRHLGGYVRMLNPPSCGRCTVLAGKFYRWNAGFRRHPRCDCRHIPGSEDDVGDLRTDPKAAFEAMTPAEQARAFGKAGAEAVRDGADLSKVVNAKRGTFTAADGRLYTHEAAGKRPRLMPEQIYREAGNDRNEAIRLLRLHGYLR